MIKNRLRGVGVGIKIPSSAGLRRFKSALMGKSENRKRRGVRGAAASRKLGVMEMCGLRPRHLDTYSVGLKKVAPHFEKASAGLAPRSGRHVEKHCRRGRMEGLVGHAMAQKSERIGSGQFEEIRVEESQQ